MKARPRSCLLTLALSLALAGPALGQSLAGNRFPKSATGGAMPAVACGPIFLTHSVSQDIISANSIACIDADGFSYENHYTRAFDLPGQGVDGFLEVCEVQVAVEAALSVAGTQPVTVYLYSTPAGTFPGGPLTPIGTAVVDVPDQDQSYLLVPISATVPAGASLVVDVASEDGDVNLSVFYIGSNNLGQTAPGYLTAPDCGVATPTDLADVPPGFPNMHIVVNALGTEYLAPANPLRVDERSGGVSSSNSNRVFEPGETVWVDPSWGNPTAGTLTFSAGAANFTGPAGPTYVVVDDTAQYGATDPGATSNCFDATADCYALQVSGTRPAPHWDATFDEVEASLSAPSTPGSVVKTWTLHVGDSFTDVAENDQFYRFIETIFHNRVTGGCGGTSYCPGNTVTRAQMAVFLLKSKLGSSYLPPPCTGTVFLDVPCTGGIFDSWIEDLAGRSITGGCGGGNYCPGNPVTRAQMAVFLLKTLLGSGYTPPACTGTVFLDVPCTGGIFDSWIEDLAGRSITGGCGGGNYCPASPNTRGQMAVFLTRTFGLLLYGP